MNITQLFNQEFIEIMLTKRHLLTLCLLAVLLVGGSAFLLRGKPVKAITEIDRILVWHAPAEAPGSQAADRVGQLAFINHTGEIQPLADVLQQSSKVVACGPDAVSPDGRRYALFQGVDNGRVASLYMMTDNDVPVLVDDTFSSLACVGGDGLFRYSPDNSKIGYVDYEFKANVDFGDGYLRIRAIDEGFTEQYSLRNVVTFDFIDNDRVGFVQFFTNQFNEADEVAITVWDGNTEREIVSYLAEERCRYTGSRMAAGPDDNLYVSLLKNCGQGADLELIRIDLDSASAESLFTVDPPGGFYPFSQTNNIFFSPDGDTLFYTLPDGVRNNSVSLVAYDLASGTSSTVIERQVEMPNQGGTFMPPAQISADGRWFVSVVTAPNLRNNSIYAVDLNDPATPPVVMPAGNDEDTVLFLGISPNSKFIVFVAGGDKGRDNSLFHYELGSGATSADRVKRGVFSPWAVISPGGTEVAILEYQIQEEGIRGVDYLNLVNIDLEGGATTTLFEGGTVENNQVINVQFAAPLRWVRAD